MSAFRTVLTLAGTLRWLVFGCAAFRDEIPQLGYTVKVAEHGSEAECYQLASLFEKQAALRIDPYKPPALPAGEYCDVTLSDTSGNHDDVWLLWDWHRMYTVVRRYGGWGLSAIIHHFTGCT